MKNLLGILVGLVLVIGVTVGCGGDAKKSAEEILDMSRQSMSKVESFHLEVDTVIRIPSTQTGVAQERELSQLVADVAAPGRLKAKLSAFSPFGGEPVEIEVEIVTIGEATYIGDPTTKKWDWRPRTEEDLVMSRLAAGAVGSMTDATKLADEAVDGVLSYRLEGNVGPDVLGPRDESTPETIPAEIWIGKDDQLVRQVRLEVEFQGAQVPGTITVSTLTLSRFNEPVTVEAPVSIDPNRAEVHVVDNKGVVGGAEVTISTTEGEMSKVTDDQGIAIFENVGQVDEVVASKEDYFLSGSSSSRGIYFVALLPAISVSQFTLRTSPSSGRGLRDAEIIKFQVGEIIEIEALVQCHGEATPGSYEVVLRVNGEIFDSLTVDRPDVCGVDLASAPFTLSFERGSYEIAADGISFSASVD